MWKVSRKYLLAAAFAGVAALGVTQAQAQGPWSGPYFGLHAGYGWGDTTITHDVGVPATNPTDSFDTKGWLLGAQLGLNVQVGSFVLGELDRIDETTATEAKSLLRRSVRQTILDHVWITTSGFFTMAPFMAALMTFGADRIMLSVDYPFAPNARARVFLDALPVSPADRAKIAHGNADQLMRLPT
jgi:opacity protein-like surface antigen